MLNKERRDKNENTQYNYKIQKQGKPNCVDQRCIQRWHNSKEFYGNHHTF